MNNIPTIVPKMRTPKKSRNTRTSLGLLPEIVSPIQDEVEEHRGNVTEETLSKEEEQALEREQLQSLVETLREEKSEIQSAMQNKILCLETNLQQTQFTVDRFKHNNAHFKFYTGFSSYALFKVILDNFFKPDVHNMKYWGSVTNNHNEKKQGRSRTLIPEDEFFLVLARLRGGFPIEDLAIRINMSTSNVSRILITWYDFLHIKLRALPIWASKQTIVDSMPKCFKDQYPHTRVIIDCTEIFTEMPTSYRSQSATFSNYKHHNTAKALVGIAPDGSVTFVSELYTGRSSDKQITQPALNVSPTLD